MRLLSARTKTVLELVFVFGCAALVASALNPHLWFHDTIPTGGDTGGHVWAPAFLRDELLPKGQLWGWAPDWYSGFVAYRWYMLPSALSVVFLDLFLPYNIAFKLVTVAGLVLTPVGAYFGMRLARSTSPVRLAATAAATAFLFDGAWQIYGGNIASTLAGEFSFSWAIPCALVSAGMVARHATDRSGPGVTAAWVAFTILCHPIVGLFTAVATVTITLTHLRRRHVLRQARWLAYVGVGAGALTAFWLAPFGYRMQFMNDMGWEKRYTYFADLVPQSGTRWWVMAAGAALPVLYMARDRFGLGLAAASGWAAAAYVLIPEDRLWGARLLPFWYLGCYLVAALGAGHIINRIRHRVTANVALGVLLAGCLLVVAVPLRIVPGGKLTPEGVWKVGPFQNQAENVSNYWSSWNYGGMEARPAWPEFKALMDTMARIGRTNGCGRAIWEYSSGLGDYGTPMAPMLLPHLTDRCIGSQEGLFFESSNTTPFHFLNQAELSAEPSSAQRDMPYVARPVSEADFDKGVRRARGLGVRYYMASSEEMKALADDHEDLTKLADSNKWRVYEIAGWTLAFGIGETPVVDTDLTHKQDVWLEAVKGRDPDAPLIALDGPDQWPRGSIEDDPSGAAVTRPAVVSNIVEATESFSFDVDRVGSPVLVRVSYDPAWKVTGAEGPYRVSPNLMVVIPTDNHVEMRFQAWGKVEVGSAVVTVLGVIALSVLGIRRRRRGTVIGGVVPDSQTDPDLRDLSIESDDAHGSSAAGDATQPASTVGDPAGAAVADASIESTTPGSSIGPSASEPELAPEGPDPIAAPVGLGSHGEAPDSDPSPVEDPVVRMDGQDD